MYLAHKVWLFWIDTFRPECFDDFFGKFRCDYNKVLLTSIDFYSFYMKLGYSTTHRTKFLQLNISKLKKTYV